MVGIYLRELPSCLCLVVCYHGHWGRVYNIHEKKQFVKVIQAQSNYEFRDKNFNSCQIHVTWDKDAAHRYLDRSVFKLKIGRLEVNGDYKCIYREVVIKAIYTQ